MRALGVSARMGVGLAPRFAGGGGPVVLPALAFNTIVIEGDSISRGEPDSGPNDDTSTPQASDATNTFPYRWRATRADKAIYNRAASSRSVGAAGNLNDNSNTIFGHVAEDVAFGPDLIPYMPGANDFTGINDATFRTRLIALRAAYANARPAMKVAWSAPIAYNPTGTPHASKSGFDTQRASLLADCRDPAVWGQWADYYNPMGEHPDFGDPAVAAPLFGDGVHPSSAGQALLATTFAAFMDSLLDASRASSTTMYSSAWIGSEANLTTSTQIVRRILVSGLAHTGTALGASVTGGGAEIRVGERAWGTTIGTGNGNGHRIYNGDVLQLRLTTSASNDTPTNIDLRIGSETRPLTFRTVAGVTPATYAHGGILTDPSLNGPATFAAVPFDSVGVGVLSVNSQGPGFSNVEYQVGAGAWTAATRRSPTSGAAAWGVETWTFPVAATGPRNIRVSWSGGRTGVVLSYGVAVNVDPTPTQAAWNNTDDTGIDSSSLTVPASGIALGFLAENKDPTAWVNPATVRSGTTAVAEGNFTNSGLRLGIAVGKRTSSGTIGFDFPPYGGIFLATIVFKAAGT